MDRATFYTAIRKGTLFDGSLSQRQVQGIEAILDAWDKSGYADQRWLAYALGTTYHETGRAMYPVPEGGRGKGHPYGVPGADGQVAYGRGYVQLTWAANYAKADRALDLGGKLIANYELAMSPPIAAQILLRGMAEAWFTVFRFGDYLNDRLADYLHARRIVNGMDQADKIAAYALIFFAAIQAGNHKADDHSAVMAAAATPASIPIIGDLAEAVTDAVASAGSILSGGPSPAAPAIPAGIPSATTGPDSMNPLVAISIIQQVITYAPAVEHIVSNIPDIIAKGKDAIAKFEKMDFAAAVTDIEGIVTDLGISQDTLASIIKHATSSAPPATAVKA